MTFTGEDRLHARGLGVVLDDARVKQLEAMCEDYGKRWSAERNHNRLLRMVLVGAGSWAFVATLVAIAALVTRK